MRTFLLSAFLLLLAATSGRANLVDNFNSENGGVGRLNYNSFANWTVANSSPQGGTVDLIGNGFFDLYPGNGLYVDLLGTGNGVPGLFTTKETFAIGTYTLSFDLAGSARGYNNHVDVSFGPYAQTFFLPSSQGYTLFSESVTLTTPAQLSFQNVESGQEGAILDNVSVISSSSVPEPGSLVLACLGTFGVIGYGWRRKRVKE